MFQQILDPIAGSLVISALCAALPLVLLFVLLGVFKVKAPMAHSGTCTRQRRDEPSWRRLPNNRRCRQGRPRWRRWRRRSINRRLPVVNHS